MESFAFAAQPFDERAKPKGRNEIELAKNMSVQNLREKIQQKYHVNLDDAHAASVSIRFADEGAAKVETLTPEENIAAGAATD